MAVNRSNLPRVALCGLLLSLGCSVTVETPQASIRAPWNHTVIVRVTEKEIDVGSTPSATDDHFRVAWGSMTAEKMAGEGHKVSLWKAIVSSVVTFFAGLGL